MEKVSYEVVNDKVTSDHMPIVGDLIIGFENPDGIETIRNADNKIIRNDVYDLSGRKFSTFKGERRESLPRGIYIFNGKKMKK